MNKATEISQAIEEADRTIFLATDLRPLEDATEFNEADLDNVNQLLSQLHEAVKQVENYLKLRGEQA